MANVIEISSDSESDYSDFGEGRSHTSIPQVDELRPLVTPEIQADSVADPSKSFNSSCGGSGLREPAVTETASSDNQKPEPLPIAAVSRITQREVSDAREPIVYRFCLSGREVGREVSVLASGTPQPRTASLSARPSAGMQFQRVFLATPAIAEPWRLPGLGRAVQQDKPGSSDSTSEAEQTSSFRETARSEAAMKIAHTTPPNVESSPLPSPKHSSLPRPRPKIGTHRESRPALVSVSRGDRDDQAFSPPRKRNGAPRSLAARHGIRDYVGSFDVHGDNGDADGVQQALANKSKLPPRRKRRRVDSQRERRLYQQDTEDTCSSAEDSSNDWVARPPRRRRVNPPDPSHTTAADGQTGSDSENTGLQQVQTQTSESVGALAAKFAEWLSQTADVRKAKVDGATIFQLRFKQDLYCSRCRPAVLGNPHSGYTSDAPARQRNSTLGRILSGESPLAENPLRSPTENDVQAPPLTESGAEYEIEEIVERRRRGRGWQVRVKWAHWQRLTWKPRKNFLGTDALIAFEAQHGPP
ncbi:hypothetical protein F5883DRAFT_653485 [Diaporthe sp. PMI_573]|nr:hypothetical protein F5883DRAFT_653485 [Diaporthaceae sp. PMI_573]